MSDLLWVDWAVKRPVHFAATQPDLVHGAQSTLVMHTNGGGTDHGSLFGWFDRAGNDICAHFQVMANGVVEQYLPLNKQAYAQFAANPFAWSVEHEDGGNNRTPLTAAQLAADNRLIDYLGVPRVLAAETGGGVGWHNQYQSWNQSAHDCVGAVREAQYRNLLAQGAPEMNVQDWKDLGTLLKAERGIVILHIRPQILNAVAAVQGDVNVMQADLDALKAEVAALTAKPVGYGA